MDTNSPTEQSSRQGTDGIIIRESTKKRKELAKRQHQEDLVIRLNHLRAEAKEVCESYLANLDADVSTLVDFLNGTSEIQKPHARKVATMKAWTKTLDRLALKPAKGRKKDLRRIDDAVRSMMGNAFD